MREGEGEREKKKERKRRRIKINAKSKTWTRFMKKRWRSLCDSAGLVEGKEGARPKDERGKCCDDAMLISALMV